MVSISKSTGQSIWPNGMSAEDVPADLFHMMSHALTILSWQENLQEDEMPPYWMWHLDWEIEGWFKKVKIKRDAKYGKSDGMDDLRPDGEPMFEKNSLFEDFLKD